MARLVDAVEPDRAGRAEREPDGDRQVDQRQMGQDARIDVAGLGELGQADVGEQQAGDRPPRSWWTACAAATSAANSRPSDRWPVRTCTSSVTSPIIEVTMTKPMMPSAAGGHGVDDQDGEDRRRVVGRQQAQQATGRAASWSRGSTRRTRRGRRASCPHSLTPVGREHHAEQAAGNGRRAAAQSRALDGSSQK